MSVLDPSKVKKLKLEWNNVTVTKVVEDGTFLKPHHYEKNILNGVSGEANPGELLAIMGPSGGGKTSLLNTLSRRIRLTSGSITLNGKKLPKNFNKVSAYVMQDDRLFETLTPRELFSFSANLRLPKETTQEEKKAAVEWVIQRLGLTSCADTRVGGALSRGLSGGERKRTSIGYELITNPSLLFLDEPTSGLDSYSSLVLLECLRDLAKDGHTIICTIHQPSSEIFALFDKLHLLAKGNVVYHGEASKSIEYFAQMGDPCPTYSNPADHFMKVLQAHTDADMVRVQRYIDAQAKKSSDTSNNSSDSHNNHDEHKLEEKHSSSKIEVESRAPFYKQFGELTKRGWITQIRNPLAFQARMGQNIVMSLLVGLVYLQLGHHQVNIGDRIGALFFVGIGQIMSALNGVLLTFPLERALLVREYSNGMYSVPSYYLGKMVSTIPFDIFFPILFSCISYFMVGFQGTAEQFFLFLLAIVMTGLTAGSMGLALGCMFPNAEVAVSLAPVVIIPFMLFAGFYVDLDSVPVWLSWIQYISIFKWSLQALLVNEFFHAKFDCAPDEFISVQTPEGTIQVCPVTDGKQVIATQGFETKDFSDYWIPIAVMAGLFVFFRIAALSLLTYQTKKAVSKNQ